MGKLTKIIVHCSDSAFGDVETIRRWHTDPPPRGRGWRDIGYHFIITNGFRKKGCEYDPATDGTIEIGRPMNSDGIIEPWEQGAHALGYNDESIGVCLIGNDYRFTHRQIYSLTILLASFRQRFELPYDAIIGHCEVNPKKTCPQLNMDLLRYYARHEDDGMVDPWELVRIKAAQRRHGDKK